MKLFNFVILGSVLAFFLVSLAFFIKRYIDNKDKLNKINDKASTIALQKSLEDELRAKKEEETKKLEAGNIATINEVIERLFRSSKLGGWVKSKTYNLYNPKTLSLIVNLSGKDELVNSKKEIVLKSGEIYTQNKHYIAVKKEYSEKVFVSALKIIEELFNSLPTLYNIYLSIYLTEEESDKQLCVLSLEANRDQFRTLKESSNPVEKIETFSPIYNYDSKNYEFKEIEPIKTPSGEISLEKTMSMKASTNTTFLGNTVISNDSEQINIKSDYLAPDNSKISSNTKISDLNGSIILDKSQLGIDKIIYPSDETVKSDKTDFDLLVDKFFINSNFKIIREEKVNDLKIIKVLDSNNQKPYLIAVSQENKIIKEDDLKSLFFKAIKDNIDKSVFITNSSFALDSVTYAGVNSIELYDQEKLNKIVK